MTGLETFAQFGLAGLLAGAFVLLHWHNVRVVIPSLLGSHREELAEERKACRDERKADRAEHREALKQITEAMTAVVQRLERIEDKIH